ncbi:MAG: hypothetical protein GY711_17240 [bacterium]|nr:hypothetical protein [bacterium]
MPRTISWSARIVCRRSSGYLFASSSPGFVVFPGGGNGNLCLGGDIGRYAQSVLNSGPGGTMAQPVDAGALPLGTAPFTTSAAAGDTWYFPFWHRDTGANIFTEAIDVTFTP